MTGKEGGMNKYLEFKKQPDNTIHILNKKRGDYLGQIMFYPQWKQFVFEPNLGTVFNDECLIDIIWRIKFMNKQKP